jgi:serine O-acetyltransferase
VFIDHGMGVVIGETAEIGDDCTIYQGVTLGGTSLARAPSATRRWAGRDRRRQCQVLGGFTVGDGARVGSSAVVLQPVPPGATAVGNPARIIQADADAQREEGGRQDGLLGLRRDAGRRPGGAGDEGPDRQRRRARAPDRAAVAGDREALGRSRELPAEDCVPQDARTTERFDAEPAEPAGEVAARGVRPRGGRIALLGLKALHTVSSVSR